MGGQNPFGKGLVEIILCSRMGGRQGKGFAVCESSHSGNSSSIRMHRMARLTGNTIKQHLQVSCRRAALGCRSRPPACLLDMQGEPLEYEEGVFLSLCFPVLPRHANPLGHMQGGYIVAALDNTLGPFSYLIAPPSVAGSLECPVLAPGEDGNPIHYLRRAIDRTHARYALLGWRGA